MLIVLDEIFLSINYLKVFRQKKVLKKASNFTYFGKFTINNDKKAFACNFNLIFDFRLNLRKFRMI